MASTERSRPKRPRKATDAPAYHEMMTRLVRRNGERAGNDTGELALLADVQRAVDAAMQAAVVTQRLAGVSWAEIGAAVGRPRQLVWRDFHAAAEAAEAAEAAARAALAVA